MSFYWEKCDICGRRRPTRTCWLYPDRNVCPYCCLACPERDHCPNPVWFPNLRPAMPRRPRSPEKRETKEAIKALEELLKKLEGN